MVETASNEQKTLAQLIRTAVGDILHALRRALQNLGRWAWGAESGHKNNERPVHYDQDHVHVHDYTNQGERLAESARFHVRWRESPSTRGGAPAFASTDGAHEDQGWILAHETERRLAERASCGESHRYNYNAELVVGVVDTARANYDSGQERVPELEPVEAMGPI